MPQQRVANPQPGIPTSVTPGDKFARLTVVRELPGIRRFRKDGRSNGVRRGFECVCQCGKVTNVSLSHLRSGHTKSCDCLQSEVVVKKNFKHGMAYTSEFEIWCGIIRRCGITKGYEDVKLHPEWRSDFMAFYAYVGPRPTEDHSIDRFPDFLGDYVPGNVRWATQKQQNRNKRTNIRIDGRLLVELAEESGVKATTVRDRWYSGMKSKDRLFAPIKGSV